MAVKLGVNIDHIATLRQARKDINPDPVEAARVAISSGADMIVMHIRGDRRHIQEHDLERMRKEVKCVVHLEMAATSEMLEIALRYLPDSVCIVPEKAGEVTTEGGLNLKDKTMVKEIENIIKALSDKGIEVSLFLNPEADDIRTAYKLGADVIELCTKVYAESWGKKNQAKELEKLQLAGYLVKELNMGLHAGHGLDYYNVRAVAKISGMDCLNIGFSIISRAVFVGLRNAVMQMKELIS
ncbi:MAG: pyridoxine 5'-phosphate synthase [Elusimicrobiales bacterium]